MVRNGHLLDEILKEKVRNIKLQSMEEPKVGLAKHAYQGAPKPLGNNVLVKLEEDRPPKILPDPDWAYKSKRLRRQEIIDSL